MESNKEVTRIELKDFGHVVKIEDKWYEAIQFIHLAFNYWIWQLILTFNYWIWPLREEFYKKKEMRKHFKVVNFMVCKLYLDKSVLKK